MNASLDPVVVRSAVGGAYEVHFGGLGRIGDYLAGAGLAPRCAFVVSDSNVAPLYLETVRGAVARAGWTFASHVVHAGEAAKSPATLSTIYDAALGAGIERGDAVLALGGGVVGDLAGYAAATWLRGLPLVHLPTSLLAQCDSSIGGKTGINHAGRKNLVGAIWPPRLVLVDVSTLDTLPPREFASGMAEVVKHALLDGPPFVDALEASWQGVMSRDAAVLPHVVRRAASVKAAVVSADERESGRREALNLGHTFGHAIEAASGFGTFTHGEAVTLGLRAALHLSASLASRRPVGIEAALPPPFDRADALVARLPATPALTARQDALDVAVGADKKRAAGASRFVVLEAIGWPRLSSDVPPEMIAAAWERARWCSGTTAAAASAA